MGRPELVDNNKTNQKPKVTTDDVQNSLKSSDISSIMNDQTLSTQSEISALIEERSNISDDPILLAKLQLKKNISKMIALFNELNVQRVISSMEYIIVEAAKDAVSTELEKVNDLGSDTGISMQDTIDVFVNGPYHNHSQDIVKRLKQSIDDRFDDLFPKSDESLEKSTEQLDDSGLLGVSQTHDNA